jgi:DNA polymerase-3 subunit alpha
MKTKKGDMMALINTRDYTGAIEMAVFPKSFEKLKAKIKVDTVCVIKGKVASRNGDKTFIVDTITDLK